MAKAKKAENAEKKKARREKTSAKSEQAESATPAPAVETISEDLLGKLAENSPTYEVSYDLIRPDHAFNSRKLYQGIEALAADIAQLGLLMPLIVRMAVDERDPKQVTYQLLAGYRRYHAIGLLRKAWSKEKHDPPMHAPFEQIACKVVDADELQGLVINLRENISRSDLKIWELGDQCSKIKKRFNLTSSQVAGVVTYQKTTIDNAIRVVENIALDLQKKFRNSAVQVPVTFLREMAGYRTIEGEPDHERQRQAWADMFGDPETPKSGEEPPRTALTGKMAKLSKAVKVLHALEASRKDGDPDKADYLRGCIAATKYLAGLNKSIPGVKIVEE